MARGNERPNKNIGEFLKARRERLNESLAEVSGAVEIDIDTLHRIEVGAELPSEDILILLMSHFAVNEAEARRLLQMADYERKEEALSDEQLAKQVFMLMPLSAQAMYADDVEVTTGKNGTMITFTQPAPNGQPMPVSRIGLSKQLAQKLAEQLSAKAEPQAPKLLTAPKQTKKQS